MTSALLVLLPCLLLASPTASLSEGEARTALELRLDEEARDAESESSLPSLKLPPLRERLLSPQPKARPDSFKNSWVDTAPKSWPFPTVVSPGRPVLPGSAW